MAPRSSHNSKKSNKTKRITQEEASFLFDRLESEERSEEAWNDMIAEPPDGEAGEDLGIVEEHLLQQPHERDAALRRWKHFGK